jgi:acyl carrier protein
MSPSEIIVINLLRAIFENRGLAPPPLSPQTALAKSLGLNSLDFADLVIRLEEATGKDPFADGTLAQVQTISDLAALYD